MLFSVIYMKATLLVFIGNVMGLCRKCSTLGDHRQSHLLAPENFRTGKNSGDYSKCVLAAVPASASLSPLLSM